LHLQLLRERGFWGEELRYLFLTLRGSDSFQELYRGSHSQGSLVSHRNWLQEAVPLADIVWIGADMAGKTDLIGAFRAYAQKALGNDFNAEKAAIALNSWVKESGDALKERIERETERAVKKLGLAKESDLRALREELAQLRKSVGLQNRKTGAKPVRTSRSQTSKKSVSPNGRKKKSAAKKSTAGRSSANPRAKRQTERKRRRSK
jgi:hypothetical protein